MPLFANWMSVPVLPLPTIAGAARTPAAARRRVIIAVCLFVIGVVTLASVGLWVPIVKSLHHKHKKNGNTMEVAVGIFKRQFQGGGIIGDLTADPIVSDPSSEGLIPDVSAFGASNLPVDAQVSNAEGLVGDIAETVGSLFGDTLSTPVQDPAVTPGPAQGVPDLSQVSTPVGLVQSEVESLLSGGLTPPLPSPTPPGTPTFGAPDFSVTLAPFFSPLDTPLTGNPDLGELASSIGSFSPDASLPVSPLAPGEVSVSLPATQPVETELSPSVPESLEDIPQPPNAEGAGLGDILSNDGTTDVDSAALLSGLSNIVEQISGVDPDAASDLTDAVVGALPEDLPDAAGVLPNAQDAIDSGSADRLDSVIPSVADAIGEDIVPVDPINPSDTSGALGNVVNRGKAIVNQINEAIGGSIDPALQDVVDNVSDIVESAEEQLEDPLCLVSQVVNGVTDQMMVPCAEAGPGAPTSIAHLAPTQASGPAQSDAAVEPSLSPQQPPNGVQSPEGVDQEESLPNQEPSGSRPSVPQSPAEGSGGSPATGQNTPGGAPKQVPSNSSPDTQVPGADSGISNGERPSSQEGSGSGDQPSDQPASQNASPGSPDRSGESSGTDTTGQDQSGEPPTQNSWEPPETERQGQASESDKDSSIQGSGSSPPTSTTPQNSADEVSSSPVDAGCPVCPQCMPQSCDGNYGFDSDQSPCEGRGFECDECLHGWFCPPRETPAQAAPCGLGWPCYHCSDGWFCVPDESSPDFVISSDANGGVTSRPQKYDDTSQTKRQSTTKGESDDEVNDVHYLGCFQDATSRTILGGVPVDYLSGRMSTSICVNHCLERGYTFAGTENGHECWCGETIRPDAKRLLDSSCQMPCHGNQGSVCGGNMAISIFADQDEYHV